MTTLEIEDCIQQYRAPRRSPVDSGRGLENRPAPNAGSPNARRGRFDAPKAGQRLHAGTGQDTPQTEKFPPPVREGWFAEWWREQTGEDIRELELAERAQSRAILTPAPKREAKPAKPAQPSAPERFNALSTL